MLLVRAIGICPTDADAFLCTRSSLALPTTLVVSLSGVDRSRYLLEPRPEGVDSGGVEVFVKLFDT